MRELAARLRASNALGGFDDALLAYAVTSDEAELARQT